MASDPGGTPEQRRPRQNWWDRDPPERGTRGPGPGRQHERRDHRDTYDHQPRVEPDTGTNDWGSDPFFSEGLPERPYDRGTEDRVSPDWSDPLEGFGDRPVSPIPDRRDSNLRSPHVRHGRDERQYDRFMGDRHETPEQTGQRYEREQYNRRQSEERQRQNQREAYEAQRRAEERRQQDAQDQQRRAEERGRQDERERQRMAQERKQQDEQERKRMAEERRQQDEHERRRMAEERREQEERDELDRQRMAQRRREYQRRQYERQRRYEQRRAEEEWEAEQYADWPDANGTPYQQMLFRQQMAMRQRRMAMHQHQMRQQWVAMQLAAQQRLAQQQFAMQQQMAYQQRVNMHVALTRYWNQQIWEQMMGERFLKMFQAYNRRRREEQWAEKHQYEPMFPAQCFRGPAWNQGRYVPEGQNASIYQEWPGYHDARIRGWKGPSASVGRGEHNAGPGDIPVRLLPQYEELEPYKEFRRGNPFPVDIACHVIDPNDVRTIRNQWGQPFPWFNLENSKFNYSKDSGFDGVDVAWSMATNVGRIIDTAARAWNLRGLLEIQSKARWGFAMYVRTRNNRYWVENVNCNMLLDLTGKMRWEGGVEWRIFLVEVVRRPGGGFESGIDRRPDQGDSSSDSSPEQPKSRHSLSTIEEIGRGHTSRTPSLERGGGYGRHVPSGGGRAGGGGGRKEGGGGGGRQGGGGEVGGSRHDGRPSPRGGKSGMRPSFSPSMASTERLNNIYAAAGTPADPPSEPPSKPPSERSESRQSGPSIDTVVRPGDSVSQEGKSRRKSSRHRRHSSKHEGDDSKRRSEGESKHDRSKDPKSHRGGDSEHHRSKDSRHHGESDSKRHRSGDPKHPKSGDSKHRRSYDPKRHSSGDSKHPRSGDSKHPISGDSKHYKGGDSRHHKSGGDRHKKGDDRHKKVDDGNKKSDDKPKKSGDRHEEHRSERKKSDPKRRPSESKPKDSGSKKPTGKGKEHDKHHKSREKEKSMAKVREWQDTAAVELVERRRQIEMTPSDTSLEPLPISTKTLPEGREGGLHYDVSPVMCFLMHPWDVLLKSNDSGDLKFTIGERPPLDFTWGPMSFYDAADYSAIINTLIGIMCEELRLRGPQSDARRERWACNLAAECDATKIEVVDASNFDYVRTASKEGGWRWTFLLAEVFVGEDGVSESQRKYPEKFWTKPWRPPVRLAIVEEVTPHHHHCH